MIELLAALRAARSAIFGSTISTGGTLTITTGTPKGVANVDSGTALSTLTGVTYTTSGGTCTLAANADTSAAANGTPGHARLLNSSGTCQIEGYAGIGTVATATSSVSGNAINAITIVGGGSGYVATDPPYVIITGGSGWGAILTPVISAGAVTSLTITNGGYGYSSAPTITIGPPFDFTFSAAVSLGGTVTFTSGALIEGNN
jgi:hypothetical protein